MPRWPSRCSSSRSTFAAAPSGRPRLCRPRPAHEQIATSELVVHADRPHVVVGLDVERVDPVALVLAAHVHLRIDVVLDTDAELDVGAAVAVTQALALDLAVEGADAAQHVEARRDRERADGVDEDTLDLDLPGATAGLPEVHVAEFGSEVGTELPATV